MIDAFTHGALNWIDLSTPDVAAATDFYGRLLGWSIEGVETRMGRYFIGSAGERQVAGMMQQLPDQRSAPAIWTTFFFVDDIDAAVAQISAAGGDVLQQPFAIPDDTRIAVVADPTGAMTGLISGPKQGGIYLATEHGAVCWVELLTRDPAAAEAFYASVFGWKAETSQVTETRYTMFTLEESLVAGMMLMPDEVPVEAPAHWAVYFAVADCAVAENRTNQLGGQALHPTTEIESGRFAVLSDPQGATFHVMEMGSAAGLE